MSLLLRMALPLTLWLASFSALYALHGLLCSSRWALEQGMLAGRAPLVAAVLLALAAQAGALWALRRWPAADPWIARVSLGLGVVALVSTVWTLLPVLTVAHCL